MSTEMLTYEEWFDLNEESITVELTDSGASREMDFDLEWELDNRYYKYLDGRIKIIYS